MLSITENPIRRKIVLACDATGKGHAAVLIDRKLHAPVFADISPSTKPDRIATLANAGVKLFRLRGESLGWEGVGTFDYSKLEDRLRKFSQSAPGAFFILELSVDAPEWWLKTHPQETVGYSSGGADALKTASFASKLWRNETGNALGRLVKYLQGSEWSNALMGVHIVAGTQGEWRISSPELGPDNGLRMTEQFHDAMREKYRRNAGLLRIAWDDPKADLHKIAVPGAIERMKGLRGVLRHPLWARKTVDFLELFSQMQNDSVLHFCKAAKLGSSGRALVGVSYAPVLGLLPYSEDGHAFPEAVLDSPDIDFFANRGGADGTVRALTGSLGLRSKFLIHEISEGSDPNANLDSSTKSNAGIALSSQSPEVFQNAITVHETRYKNALSAPKPIRTLAVIVDLASRNYLADAKPGKEPIHKLLIDDQIEEVRKSEISHEIYLPSDLFHHSMPNYKCYILINCLYLSDAERRKIEAKVKRSEQMGIFMWGAGVLSSDNITSEAAEKLTGMKSFVEDRETSLRVRVTARDPGVGSWQQGRAFGSERALLPVLTIGDREAARIGINSADRTTFAVHRYELWTSYNCQSPALPAGLLKTILAAGFIAGEKVEKKVKQIRRSKPKPKRQPVIEE